MNISKIPDSMGYYQGYYSILTVPGKNENLHPAFPLTGSFPMQDPKTSRWLWDLRERARQKKRTEHYRQIMRMQEDNADQLLTIDVDDGPGGGGGGEDSAAGAANMESLTKLAYIRQMENYLSYGQWDLSEEDIERLKKDEDMKQRVREQFSRFP